MRRERKKCQGRTYIIVALITILTFLVAAEEEVQRRTLNLGDRMKAPQCNNGDRLGVIPVLSVNHYNQVGCRGNVPNTLLPELFGQHHSPHGFVTAVRQTLCICVWVAPELPFVPHDRPTHSTLNHAKEHGLHGTIELVIFGALVSSLDISEDIFSESRTQ